MGAGPGDAELLTVKAQRILKTVDVVLYDFLVPPSLLMLCKPEAKLMCVGKRKGFHSKTQAQIHKLIQNWVQKGCSVARLKGGDPLMFGRGGEEMEFLRSRGISYEVVPGVSSGFAVPAYAGIPLTHRTLSTSVAFVSATLKRGKTWKQVPLPKADTLVFFMALTQLEGLVQRLLGDDLWTLNTPVAVLYKGTTAAQETLSATLGTVVQKTKVHGLVTPALLMVGRVTILADSLKWRESLPLFGKRIVLCRQTEQSDEWKQGFQALGAEVLEYPLLSIEFNKNSGPRALRALQKANQVVFTSANGVRFLFQILFEQRLDARQFYGKVIMVVGQKTAEALEKWGLKADFLAKKAQVEGILDTLPTDLKGQHFFLPQSARSRALLKDTLVQRGAQVSAVALYKPVAKKPLFSLELRPNDVIMLTSTSMAEVFFEKFGTSLKQFFESKKRLTLCCIGPVTYAGVMALLEKYPIQLNVVFANDPSLEGVLNIITETV